MQTFSIAERRNRLAFRHFPSGSDSQAIAAITAALVGLHATDPTTPYLSLWAKCPSFVTADLDGELYRRRSMVSRLAMRRTLWLVNTDDLAIVQPAIPTHG